MDIRHVLTLVFFMWNTGVSGYHTNLVTNHYKKQKCESELACPPAALCRNVALNKPVAISSTHRGGIASLVVDGSALPKFPGHDGLVEGHCSHTALEVRPWIRIDLQESYTIDAVKIWTRNHSNHERDANLEIRVGDDPADFKSNSLCKFIKGHVGLVRHVCCMEPVRGRYLTVERTSDVSEFMHICEVKALTCTSRCQSYGNTNIKQFSGRWINTFSPCSYILARDQATRGVSCGIPRFQVTSHPVIEHDTSHKRRSARLFAKRDHPYDRVYGKRSNNGIRMESEKSERMRAITLTLMEYHNLKIDLLPGLRVQVDGVDISGSPFLPRTDITITRSLDHVFVDVDSHLRLKWDGKSDVEVAMPSHLAVHMTGVCGYDFGGGEELAIGESAHCLNDSAAASKYTEDEVAFVNSWVHTEEDMDKACNEHCSSRQISDKNCHVDQRQAAASICKALNATNTPLKKCVKLLGSYSKHFVERCMADICLKNVDKQQAVCSHAHAMVTQCANQFDLRLDWRKQHFCPYSSCSNGSTYQAFGMGCAASCQEHSKACYSTDLWQEGCVCDLETVPHNGKCISKDVCGCRDEKTDSYIQKEQSFLRPDCSERCTCDESGLTCKLHKCPSDKRCLVKNGKAACKRDRCSIRSAPGNCSDNLPRWFFDHKRHTCRRFNYTGCDGNMNNFKTRAQCLWHCAVTISPDIKSCMLPKENGNCQGSVHRFFFDHKDGLCKKFRYSCGGNSNVYASLRECKFHCYPWLTPERCRASVDPGTCLPSNEQEAWYYDAISRRCQRYVGDQCQAESGIISGSQTKGNRSNDDAMSDEEDVEGTNRFPTEADCRLSCAPWKIHTIPAYCQLPAVSGNCDGNVMQWYYNHSTVNCAMFQYTGCNGNDNRFARISDCRATCMTGSVVW